MEINQKHPITVLCNNVEKTPKIEPKEVSKRAYHTKKERKRRVYIYPGNPAREKGIEYDGVWHPRKKKCTSPVGLLQVGRNVLDLASLVKHGAWSHEFASKAFTRTNSGNDTAGSHTLDLVLAIPGYQVAIVDCKCLIRFDLYIISVLVRMTSHKPYRARQHTSFSMTPPRPCTKRGPQPRKV